MYVCVSMVACKFVGVLTCVCMWRPDDCLSYSSIAEMKYYDQGTYKGRYSIRGLLTVSEGESTMIIVGNIC